MEQLDKQITFFEKEARRLKEKVSTLELQKEGLLTRYCYDRHILKIESEYQIEWYFSYLNAQLTLLQRLSEVAGLRLCDNNPNIQDLSDTKRPTKIVEAFGELYDNEWTNALEDLLKTQHSEREAIDTLAGILKVWLEPLDKDSIINDIYSVFNVYLINFFSRFLKRVTRLRGVNEWHYWEEWLYAVHVRKTTLM